MRLACCVYLHTDSLGALVRRLEDETHWAQAQDSDAFLEGFYELREAYDQMIQREADRMRAEHWDELPEALGLKAKDDPTS